MPEPIVSGAGVSSCAGVSGCGDVVMTGAMATGAFIGMVATVVTVIAVVSASVGVGIVCGRGGGGTNPGGCSHCDSGEIIHVQ